MAIWWLRLVLLVTSVWLGHAALDAVPGWMPPLDASRTILGPFAILAAGILTATFAPAEQVRNLAGLAGWTLCLGTAALIGPGLVARFG